MMNFPLYKEEVTVQQSRGTAQSCDLNPGPPGPQAESVREMLRASVSLCIEREQPCWLKEEVFAKPPHPSHLW